MSKITLLTCAAIAAAFVFYKIKPVHNYELDSMSRKHNGLNIPASRLDFNNIDGFEAVEFQDQLHLLDAQVIYVLVKLRKLIGRIRISPAEGAIARTDGKQSTMHFADLELGRLSEAVDIMPLDVDLETAYKAALTIPEIGAVGAYPDWKPLPGLHIDLRKRKQGNRLSSWSRKIVDGEIIDSGINEAFV